MLQRIRVAKLDVGAKAPTRNHTSDAGMDFYALREEIIYPQSETIVSTGITMEIPEGFVGILKPKGRNEHMLNAGVIDAGYQGEVIFRIVNPFDYKIYLHPGDAIGQMLLLPVETPLIEEVPNNIIHATETERGARGGMVDKLQGQER